MTMVRALQLSEPISIVQMTMNAQSNQSRRIVQYALPFVLLLAHGVPESRAQTDTGSNVPIQPGLRSTSQLNPRGADIVEPTRVFKITYAAHGSDTAYVGTAKIPDPRKGEEGAFTNVDLATGTLIRLGGAWIYSAAGHRQIVQFDPRGRDLIVFENGPHDVVESRQGVQPLVQQVGGHSIFDLRDLYEGAQRSPMFESDHGRAGSAPRIALMRMRSTYRNGEAVDLAVVLAPDAPPTLQVMQPLVVVQRDTVILAPKYEIVINRTEEVVRSLAALVYVETGYGNSFTSTAVPATVIPPFTSDGRAGDIYVDAKMQLRQGQNRWTLRAIGTSAVTATDLARIDHHQVALYADARFESGDRRFLLAQVSAEMRDKQYQEFDWNSADYAGSMFVGYGRRKLARNGVETRRVQVLLGMRMGENRPIEIMETRPRSRGIGPAVGIGGEVAKIRRSGVELRVGTDLSLYTVSGRGHRDRGFAEKGLLLHNSAEMGYELRGAYVYGALNLLTTALRAEYPSGGRYSERKTMLAPGLGVQMRL